MAKPVRVLLEPYEQILADRRLGRKHVPVGEKSCTRNTSPWMAHYFGLQGEIAVSKLVEFPIGEFISPSGDGDEPDLYWGRRSVEVKSTKYAPPILKLDKLTDFVTDVCILCHIAEESVIDVYCWISQEEFFSRHKIQDFGYGGRAVVGATGLNPAGDLNGWEHPGNQVCEDNTF